MRPTRRAFALAALATVGAPVLSRAQTGDPRWLGIEGTLGWIELAFEGRLGVALLDSANGARAGYREEERFPMCSTFKLLAAAAVLARVDRGEESLARRIVFTARDLVSYSPATEKRTGGEGMRIAELCEAALTLSDNTAGNLLLSLIGGPKGLTAYARTLGDNETRLDRIEPALNEATPGDPRDTTTPRAMLGNLQRLLLGDALAPASRAWLLRWLHANRTGDERLRAGVPKDWRVGDKTGSGDHGTASDIAILTPPGRAPILAAVYLTQTEATMGGRNSAIAAIGQAVARRF